MTQKIDFFAAIYLYIIKPPKLSSNYPEIQRRVTNQTNFTTFSGYLCLKYINQNFFKLIPPKSPQKSPFLS